MNIMCRGKIARLPQHIREVINRHLRDGEDGRTLTAMLNRLPEVQAVMAVEFGGSRALRRSMPAIPCPDLPRPCRSN